MSTLYNLHKDLLNQAIKAQKERTFFAAFPEHPKAYPEDADDTGRSKFKELLGSNFEELHVESAKWTGKEISPYTLDDLNVEYPDLSSKELVQKGMDTFTDWRNVSAEDRAGILIESLMRFKQRFFEVAYATMHTTGQGYMMSFQASGPHAADRAFEAIATGYEEITKYPENIIWEKPMGKYSISLQKKWIPMPKGLSVVIGCSTFPVWNSTPGIYGSLITGNPVIVKPHPGAILPIAIVVAEIRNVLREEGLNPDICQLAADTVENPKTIELAEHDSMKIIDFTGNSNFGTYLEGLKGKSVFTEKTGVNSIILESVEDIDAVAANLAFSICLYSGQMCTAPQNFFIPAEGIKTKDGNVGFDEFAQKLTDQINGLVNNPKAGPYVLGAIQNQATCDRTLDAHKLGQKIWLESNPIENPQFPKARTLSPSIISVDSVEIDKFSQELFGPILVLIKTKDINESIHLASHLAKDQGAISCGAYTTDEKVMDRITYAMALSATSVSFNLTGGIYVNQNAAFSDFHVTGGNPSGNASFTNGEFITRRFTWVGIRKPA